jgi:hypothetical protein
MQKWRPCRLVRFVYFLLVGYRLYAELEILQKLVVTNLFYQIIM